MSNFPVNMLQDLFISIDKLPDDFWPTYHYVCKCALTDREREILELRYDDATLDFIGVKFGLSKQRISIILQSIMSKLSVQKYKDMLTYGIDGYIAKSFSDRMEELKDVYLEELKLSIATKSYEKGYQKGYADAQTGTHENRANMDAIRVVRTASLTLSVRLANCCARNNLMTLGDLIDLGDSIADLRSFGKNCFWEVLRILQSYNVDVISIYPRTIMRYGMGVSTNE